MGDNLELFIVIHNLDLIEDFKSRNKELYDNFSIKFILVGNHVNIKDTSNILVPYTYSQNIEHLNTLLTFTAWYFLINNSILQKKYIGIFEYDCDISKDILNLEFNNKLIGFSPVPKNTLYLRSIPKFTELLSIDYINAALNKTEWNASTNGIFTIEFLINFVDWYTKYIFNILQYSNHPHFHERAISIYAAKHDYEWDFYPTLLKHYEKRSHKIEL